MIDIQVNQINVDVTVADSYKAELTTTNVSVELVVPEVTNAVSIDVGLQGPQGVIGLKGDKGDVGDLRGWKYFGGNSGATPKVGGCVQTATVGASVVASLNWKEIV